MDRITPPGGLGPTDAPRTQIGDSAVFAAKDADIARLTAALERTEENRDAILADLAGVTAERDTARAEGASLVIAALREDDPHAVGVLLSEVGVSIPDFVEAILGHVRLAQQQALKDAAQEALRCASDYPTSDGVELGCRRSSDAILALAARIEAGEEVGRG